MTIAEAVNNAIEVNREGDNWEIMEQVSKSLFDQHRTMNDDGDIVGFEDGSFYSFDPNFNDGDDNRFFPSRANLMQSIDAYNSVLDYTDSRCPVMEYSGVVHGSGDRIDTLELTNIVDASGKRVEFVSTERYDEEEDSCYIEYRTNLAEAIGERVHITAREDSYVADGCSPRGFSFSFKEPVLLDVTLLEVITSTPELQTMEATSPQSKGETKWQTSTK
jgi:hypothetical protein